jgi:hypothetical protein
MNPIGFVLSVGAALRVPPPRLVSHLAPIEKTLVFNPIVPSFCKIYNHYVLRLTLTALRLILPYAQQGARAYPAADVEHRLS